MAAQGTFEVFDEHTEALTQKLHQYATDDHKISLHTTLPDTNTATPDYADFTATEVSGGSGYTTTGAAATITVGEAAGVTTVTLGADVVWSQNGAGPTDIEAGVLYSTTAASSDALGTIEMTVDAGTTPISLQAGDITISAGTVFIITK